VTWPKNVSFHSPNYTQKIWNFMTKISWKVKNLRKSRALACLNLKLVR